MKQRQADAKRLEEQQATYARQNNNDNGGLRVSLMEINLLISFLSFILVANELIFQMFSFFADLKHSLSLVYFVLLLSDEMIR